jgi:hypothetical protein
MSTKMMMAAVNHRMCEFERSMARVVKVGRAPAAHTPGVQAGRG